MEAADFAFATDLRLRIRGDEAAVRHARREYGPAEVPDAGRVDLDVTFGALPRRAGPAAFDTDATIGRGGHKTVAWSVAAGDPDATPLVARISTRGWPTGFALSLVQGYVVEPMLSTAAVRRGVVLVPGAGIELDDGMVLLLGRSRAGKSTLAARALTAGRAILGDDQLFVGPDATAWPFPRSLRFYPDLAETAPRSYAQLDERTRRDLRFRAALATVSAGYVRPSLAVSGSELGQRWHPEPRRIARLVLIERDTDRSDLETVPASPNDAVEWAAGLLEEQRQRLAALGGAGWRQAIDRIAHVERTVLERSFAGRPVVRLGIPASWDAATAVEATARWLGIDRRPG